MTDEEFAAGVDEIIATEAPGHAAHRRLDELWTQYALSKGGLIAGATAKWMAAIEGHHADDQPYPQEEGALNTSLLLHIQDMSDRDLEHANEEAIALQFKTARAVVRRLLKDARANRGISEWR